MARLSDEIEIFIKGLLNDSEGIAEIQRNELASFFNCVPSQINYVISTRFSNCNGYYVESRRGGGGSIRITRVEINSKQAYLMHIVNSMGSQISQNVAHIFINNFKDYDMVTTMEDRVLKAATSDKSLIDLPIHLRDQVRSRIMKNIILSML